MSDEGEPVAVARGPGSGVRARVLMLVENLSVPLDRRVWQECLTLRDAGLDVVVVCPKGEDRDREPFELRDGVAIHRYDARFSNGTTLGYLHEYATAFRATRRLCKQLAREMSFDVVHAANPPDFLLLAARPLRRRGARFVFDHHDLSPELYLARLPSAARTRLVHRLVHRMLLLSERMAFRQADVVIATNQSYRRIATTRGGKSPADVFVVRNAPDPERFHPNPVVRDRDGKHVIGYVGMIGPQDGVDHALRALRSLRSRRDDWRAFFAGDGDALPELQRLAQQLELDDVVEFLGLVGQDDVVRLLSTADVCLAPEPRNPANEASTMIKVAEYMSMGRPVVAYDLAETRATAGPAALYAERDDPEALADAIDLLLDDPMRRETMGNAGRKRVVEKLAWTYSARALEAAYGRVLDVTAVRSTADAAERGTTDACSVSSS